MRTQGRRPISLGQFGQKRKTAEKAYRGFVYAGIGKKGIWDEVKGQSVLGEDNFMQEMTDYVKGERDIGEIPRRQRYLDRPALDRLIDNIQGTNRYEQALLAVEKYGYFQREVASYLKVHYTTVSRMLRK